LEEDIIKKIKKLVVDHNTAGRIIEKLVEDDLKRNVGLERGGPPPRPKPLYPHT
jgi:hypothetical protein